MRAAATGARAQPQLQAGAYVHRARQHESVTDREAVEVEQQRVRPHLRMRIRHGKDNFAACTVPHERTFEDAIALQIAFDM